MRVEVDFEVESLLWLDTNREINSRGVNISDLEIVISHLFINIEH